MPPILAVSFLIYGLIMRTIFATAFNMPRCYFINGRGVIYCGLPLFSARNGVLSAMYSSDQKNIAFDESCVRFETRDVDEIDEILQFTYHAPNRRVCPDRIAFEARIT